LDVILDVADSIDGDSLSRPDRQRLQLAFVYLIFELNQIEGLLILTAGVNQFVDQERTQDD